MHINGNNIIILPIYSVIFSPLSLAIIIRVYVIIPITHSVEEYYNLLDENDCVVDSTECVYLYIFLFNINITQFSQVRSFECRDLIYY